MFKHFYRDFIFSSPSFISRNFSSSSTLYWNGPIPPWKSCINKKVLLKFSIMFEIFFIRKLFNIHQLNFWRHDYFQVKESHRKNYFTIQYGVETFRKCAIWFICRVIHPVHLKINYSIKPKNHSDLNLSHKTKNVCIWTKFFIFPSDFVSRIVNLKFVNECMLQNILKI